MKYRKTINIVLAFLIIVFLTLSISSYKNLTSTPYDYIRKQKQYGANECLHEEKLDDDKYIVFYTAKNGWIKAAIMRKDLFRYDVLYASGIPSYIDKYDFRIGEIRENKFEGNKSKENRWLFWGIISDDSVKDVRVNGVSANILNTQYPFRICYFIGNGALQETPDYEIVY